MNVQLLQHHLLKRLALLHCIIFASLIRINRLFFCESISGISYSVPLIYLSIYLSTPQCLHNCSFVLHFEYEINQKSKSQKLKHQNLFWCIIFQAVLPNLVRYFSFNLPTPYKLFSPVVTFFKIYYNSTTRILIFI